MNTIETLTKELAIRQIAAQHLKGIPKQQNACDIERLYDRLCSLHIAAFEVA